MPIPRYSRLYLGGHGSTELNPMPAARLPLADLPTPSLCPAMGSLLVSGAGRRDFPTNNVAKATSISSVAAMALGGPERTCSPCTPYRGAGGAGGPYALRSIAAEVCGHARRICADAAGLG